MEASSSAMRMRLDVGSIKRSVSGVKDMTHSESCSCFAQSLSGLYTIAHTGNNRGYRKRCRSPYALTLKSVLFGIDTYATFWIQWESLRSPRTHLAGISLNRVSLTSIPCNLTHVPARCACC